ncbi:MAG: hypothetical protein UW76_C0023G0006 [Parcubacteria group bacterium GW2011_GWF2_44_8b]|nr:MAG: hypothetical protein UV94_C0019G0008 [Parcubacteria group bacterium GW2011_GWC1_43_30]KKT79515.1 MAG: hypothetical protein UW76_C0023G0006 [Parcubacteria group bacterium GW2011_GWF2_44_8b]KKT85343.1 MAG: hypothetical protein UW83_C0021G0005 [Parcubacteria group bacterium GW2011_GWD1_44_9]
MKTILLIAGLGQRYYYDPFLKACETKDLRICIFDPNRFPSEASISIAFDVCGALTGFIDVLEYRSGELMSSRLLIQDINIAWYLREDSTQVKEGNFLEDRFSNNESRGAIRSFLSVLRCKWVNRKETIDFLASNKLYQQLIANHVGLLVPATLISNNADSVTNFSDPEEGLLLKSIGYIKLDEEGRKFLYSQRFSHSEIVESAEAIRRCPIFCQEYVQKLYEYRVMVIGNRVLACRIDSQASEKTKVDWRHYDFENVEHSPVELPLGIQENLLRFMKMIGLQYGAIDLIETPKREFVFLEVNPSGQWGWIADFARLPIPEAVVEMLETL